MKLSHKPVEQRHFAQLALALSIAFVLIALGVLINFSDGVYRFFSDYADTTLATVLLNSLVVWLAVLLYFAFKNWREMQIRQRDLESIVSSISPDALLVVDPDRTIRMCNSSVARIFGWDADEILGRTTDLLYFDRRSNPGAPREIYEALEEQGFHYGTATGKHRDGRNIPLEIIAGDLVGKRGAVLLVRDITERLAVEETQRKLEERALLTQKLESLGVLAGGIAHDFNNLLMVIQGHSDLALMKKDLTVESAQDSFKEIRAGTVRARDLCQHLLSFAGRAPRNLTAVDLRDVARDTIRMLDVRIPNSVKVDCQLDDEVPKVHGDASQLHQVALNLFTNACEAMGEAGGTLSVSTGTVSFTEQDLEKEAVESAIDAGDYVFLKVRDTGQGMDDVTRRRVWEPFFTTKDSGTGMGMAAVLGIVRSHKGAVRVESVLGEGATFTVLFPAINPADARAVILA